MIVLESERMRAEVDPAFGGRVCALWDKRAGREWLVTGPREGDAGDAAPYGSAQARGWDECFPTVGPCAHDAWGRLRDHGLLWGRPWRVAAHGATLRATCRGEGWSFSRTLDLHGATLAVLYEVECEADRPWMWSQHCLLAARPGERIVLEGFEDFTAGGEVLGWPVSEREARARDLSVVGAPEEGWALKAYARARGGPVRAEVRGEEGGIALEWDGASLPALGLWLDWGGWPADPALGPPVHQLALEPATAPADDLAGAEGLGAARRGPASWRTTLTLTDPS